MSPPLPHQQQREEPSNADLANLLGQQNDRLSKIERALIGTLEDPESGMAGKVLRMEKQINKASGLAWTAISGAASLIGLAVWKLITGEHPNNGH